MKLEFLEGRNIGAELCNMINILSGNDQGYIDIFVGLLDLIERGIDSSVIVQIAKNIMSDRKKQQALVRFLVSEELVFKAA